MAEKLLKLRLEEGAQVPLEITVRKVGRAKNLKAIAERKLENAPRCGGRLYTFRPDKHGNPRIDTVQHCGRRPTVDDLREGRKQQAAEDAVERQHRRGKQ